MICIFLEAISSGFSNKDFSFVFVLFNLNSERITLYMKFKP